MIRWTARMKAEMIAAIAAGEITEAEACRRNDLSIEELQEWRENFAALGLDGLRSTWTQLVRAHRRSG